MDAATMQVFVFTDHQTRRTLAWNIDLATELMNARAHCTDLCIIELANIRFLLSRNSSAATIDPNFALTRDLESPLLIIESPFREGENIIIDGWHRMKKADLTDTPHLYMAMLTKEEEEDCRIEL